MRSLWIYIFLLVGIVSLYAETRNLGDGRTETINGNSYTLRWQQNFNNGGSVNVTMTGTIKDGKKDGVWKISGTWNKCPVDQNDFYTGTASMTRSYNNGVPNGAFSLNYGLKHMTGRYVPKLGTWQYSAPNNVAVTASGNFKNGKPDGIWKMSNARTGKSYTMTFHNGRPHGTFDNGAYVYDEGLVIIRKYNGVAGYALIDEVKQTFDRNGNPGKNSFPLIDQGQPTAPYFYMKGGDFAEWLGRYGGKSTEDPVFETFEPTGAYLQFNNIKQLDDPQFVQQATAKVKEWQKVLEDKELAKQIRNEINSSIDSIKKLDTPYIQFVNHIFGNDVNKYYAQLILSDPKYKDFLNRVSGPRYDEMEFKYFREGITEGNNKTYTLEDRKNIIDSVTNQAKNEALFYYYSDDLDSLQNFIYIHYRPSMKEYEVIVYDDYLRKRDKKHDWSDPDYKRVQPHVLLLATHYPIGWHNSDEWYEFLTNNFYNNLHEKLEITEEDIQGFVIDKFVSLNGNKFKIQSPKKNSVTDGDVFEYVFKRRLVLSPEVALKGDYRKHFYASWAPSKKPEFIIYNIAESLKNDKKFNKIVEELASICVY